MERDHRSIVAAWVLVGIIFAGIVLFGATRVPVGEYKFDTRDVFAGLVLLSGAALLLGLPRDRRPGLTWLVLVLAFPAWLLVQQVPLPRGLIEAIAPATAGLLEQVWPGPVAGCDGTTLIAPSPPSWHPLTLDPALTRSLMFRVAAAALVFLGARAVFGAGGRPRRRLFYAVSLFAAVEAAYALGQWMTGATKILWLEKTAYLDSATGTLVNRNHFALLLYLGLGCTLSLLVRESHHAGRQQRYAALADRWLASRATLSLLVGLQLAGIVASKSRAGFAAGLLVLLPCLPALLGGRRMARVLGWLVLALVAVPALLLAGPPLLDRLAELPREWTSPSGRGAVLRLMWGVVVRFPVFGSGGGTFEWMFLVHRPAEIVGRYDYAHNDYLQTAVETGFVGLALLLAPAVAFFAGQVRTRVHDVPERRYDWPLLLALAAVAVHELVDFTLQLPAPMMFAALLAGAACRPGEPPSHPGRAARVVGAAAVPLGLAALLFGLATWPGISGALDWPDRPAELHEAASDAAGSEGEGDPCAAMRLEARAQRKRPLSAYFALAQAGYTLAAIRQETFAADVGGDSARRQALHQMAIARTLNPWESLVRERLMVLSLAVGELPAAFENARAAGRVGGVPAERVVDKLVEAGLPLDLVGPELAKEPALLNPILDRALRDESLYPLARQLVPPDITPTRDVCAFAYRVAGVLRRIQETSPYPFLEGCLEIAREEPKEFPTPDAVSLWIAQELERDGRTDEAVSAALELPRTTGRCALLIRAYYGQQEWEALTRETRQCLDDSGVDPHPTLEAHWYARLGEAYERRDRRRLAIYAFEHAVHYHPGSPHYRRILAALERGERPFKD